MSLSVDQIVAASLLILAYLLSLYLALLENDFARAANQFELQKRKPSVDPTQMGRQKAN